MPGHKAKSNATLRSIAKNISKVYGLPFDSIAFIKPDGTVIRKDAFVGTLRRHWEE